MKKKRKKERFTSSIANFKNWVEIEWRRTCRSDENPDFRGKAGGHCCSGTGLQKIPRGFGQGKTQTWFPVISCISKSICICRWSSHPLTRPTPTHTHTGRRWPLGYCIILYLDYHTPQGQSSPPIACCAPTPANHSLFFFFLLFFFFFSFSQLSHGSQPLF